MDPQSQGARTTPPKLSAQPPATLQAEPQPQPRLRVPGHSGPTESSTSDGPRPPYGTRRGSPSPAAFTDFRTPQRKTTPREHESKRHPDPSSRPRRNRARRRKASRARPARPPTARLPTAAAGAQAPRAPGRPRVPPRAPSSRAGRGTHHRSRAPLRPRAALPAPLPALGRAARTARLGPEGERGSRYEPREAGPPTGQWRGAGVRARAARPITPGAASPARARALTLGAPGPRPRGPRAHPRRPTRAGAPAPGAGSRPRRDPARGRPRPGSRSAAFVARRREPRRPLSSCLVPARSMIQDIAAARAPVCV